MTGLFLNSEAKQSENWNENKKETHQLTKWCEISIKPKKLVGILRLCKKPSSKVDSQVISEKPRKFQVDGAAC